MPTASTDGDNLDKSNFSRCLASHYGKQGPPVTCMLSKCNITCENTLGIRKCYRTVEKSLRAVGHTAPKCSTLAYRIPKTKGV